MAKINIPFNNKDYFIDESSLSSAASILKNHLSTAMSGSGSVIELDGVLYNIDSAKLATATNAFVSHLGTISGSGSKVVVNDVEYNIATSKITNAIAELEVVLGDLQTNGDENEGSGSNETFPISWNTFAVMNNASFSFEGMTFVKISDKTPSVEELASTVMSGNIGGEDMTFACDGAQDLGGIVAAMYMTKYAELMCVSVSAAGEYFGMTIPEAGLYMLDIGSLMGVDADIVLDIGNTPPAPVAETITGTSVVLVAIDGCEYSIDNETWQDSPVFTDLSAGTRYTFYARYKATDSSAASAASQTSIYTLSAPNPWYQQVTTTTITLGAINDCEFSIDGINWQTETKFTGLSRNTPYTVYARYTSEEAGDTSLVGSTTIRTKEYTDFEIDQSNKAKVGYTGEDEESLIIPDTFYDAEDNEWYRVTRISYWAFLDCNNLTSVTIPDSVTYIDSRAFLNCANLISILVDPNNPNYCSDTRGVLFDKNMKTLIQAPLAISGQYIVPDGVETIEYGAFDECIYLTDIVIPDSVSTIGTHAFANCISLNSIVISNNVTEIKEATFYGCENLTSVVFRGSITTIGRSAFNDCYRLTNIDIPDSVISIDYGAFNSVGVKSFTIPASVTSIGRWAFSSIVNHLEEGLQTGTDNIVFENPNGWWYASSPDATSGTAISAADLSNPATAATYLTNSNYYRDYYWFRS